MSEQRQYRAGETFVLPVTFQLLKVLGSEDHIYYLCAPCDDAKQIIALKDPFFIVSMEKNEENLTIPLPVLQRAAEFVSLEATAEDDSAAGDASEEDNE